MEARAPFDIPGHDDAALVQHHSVRHEIARLAGGGAWGNRCSDQGGAPGPERRIEISRSRDGACREGQYQHKDETRKSHRDLAKKSRTMVTNVGLSPQTEFS